ncbi:MAG TPA: hypothetical protein VFV52_10210, partial [Bacilli bacterium]|nr:hypothetical protein [Bacilli bacterium]
MTVPVLHETPVNLPTLRVQFEADLRAAGLAYDTDLVTRFLASCMSKPFAILSGLSGSGKTKLAQALAHWFQGGRQVIDPFQVGRPIGDSQYVVHAADSRAVEATYTYKGETKLVIMPRVLIREWADAIVTHEFSRNMSSDEIRQVIKDHNSYSSIQSSFHAPLKVAAFALIDARQGEVDADGQQPGQVELLSVGSDWTSRDPILGYPDALHPQRYVKTPALDLILRAKQNPRAPYFLILDEMNLSHVERYFADILSAIESQEPIFLHNDPEPRDGVPPKIDRWPDNLFVIGTVNVDETTYMFSPKVLDRANVIEFAVELEEMVSFLEAPSEVRLEQLWGAGAEYGEEWMRAVRTGVEASEETRTRMKEELLLLFQLLKRHNAEYGFRVAKEIARFVGFHEGLGGAEWRFEAAMDAQIVQKLLPK